MKSSMPKMACIAAMLVLMLGLASSAWATSPTFPYFGGVPWQVGDIVVCFGTGTCNVLRSTTSGLMLLDQISDHAQPNTTPSVPGVANAGHTMGVAINNTLHLVVTDNGSGSGSNVVVFTIASLDPTTSPGTAIAHTPVATLFNGSTGNSSNAQDIAVDSSGHMYVGNNVTGGDQASIVELKPNGNFLNSFLIPNVTTPAWTANHMYAANATVLDPNGHVQKVTTPGTSGPLFPPFDQFSGQATDGLTWQNQGSGSADPWTPSTFYAVGATVLDTGSNVELAITAGTSGGGSGPTWSPSTGGTTIDNAVTWQDQASPVSGPCIEKQLNSLDLNTAGDTVYFTSGPGGIIQKVVGLSTCSVFADFGPNVTLHGIKVIPANALPTNCNSSLLHTTATCPTGEALLVVASGTQFIDESDVSDLPGGSSPDSAEFSSGQDIFDICTGGSELTPAPAPPGPSGSGNSCALLLDNTGHIVARYPVNISSPVSTLQALALDPLVSDCSSIGSCSSSVPPPKVSNFWLGDSQSANFYEVNFGSGNVTSFNASGNDANADCSSHPSTPACTPFTTGIQGMRIFGAEGANQADLTKLFFGALPPSSNNSPPVYAQKVSFPPSDLNTMNAGVYGLITDTPPNATFYASLVSKAGPPNNGNDSGSGATDGGVSCQPTVPSAPNSCIVWKLDVLTNSGAPLPSSSYVSTNFGVPAGTTDPGTHVFLDEHYDVTTFVGNLDPGGGGRISVWSLQEVPQVNFSGSSLCAFSSPVNACYKTNRTTLPFTVPKCSGLLQTQFQSLPQTLLLSLVGVGSGTPKPPPNIIKLTATNTKGPFRYDSSKNQLQFNWTVNGNATAIPGTYRGCALDTPGTKGFSIDGFCVNFTLSNSCK